MKDVWDSSDSYEYFMGRWSSLMAQSFLAWLSPSFGLKWLDVGCGTGALSEMIVNKYDPASLTAIDQTEEFVKAAQKRLGNQAICKVGDALDLPLEKSSVDLTVSGLVLNFLSDKEKALSEMMRVTNKGDMVALYVWDYGGKMEFLKKFWDTVVELDPNASHLHEGSRFRDTAGLMLKDLFEKSGLKNIETAPIEVNTHFQNFEDFWQPFFGGQGPAPSYVLSLDEPDRKNLRDILYKKLPVQPDGSIPMTARAWAARGTV
jgi:ubiquinone/menaquinone biosynthesis C-methylase UbiE